MREPLDQSTDTLIIGGGIVGCCTALSLARAGRDVVVLEQHDLHTQASGSNAGNIHQQILPANHIKTRGWEWIAHYAQVVRHYVAAGLLWQELVKELDVDVEMKFLGGITVGETEEDMAIIARKCALEQANGGGVVLLSRAELRDLAPYISDRMIGGCLCPAEGKVNPLLAVPAIARLAVRHGARFWRHEKVLALEGGIGGGYTVTTTRRSFACKNLVIAAGPDSGELAKRLGVDVPIAARIIQTSVSEPSEPVIHHLLYHVTRPLTMKQVTNGNVVMGGGWPGITDPKTGHPLVSYESLTGSTWVAQHVVPAVGRLRLLRAWAACIFNHQDGLPVCGEVPGKPGLYLAISNSYGFTIGPLVGRLLSEMVTGRELSIDADLLRVDR